MISSPLLTVSDLNVGFDTPAGEVLAVKNVSFELPPGENLGIVGESGSGKSQTVFSLMGLLAANGWASGNVEFAGKQLTLSQSDTTQGIRGDSVSMIFQDPMTSLNPYLTVGQQMRHVLTRHKGLNRPAARRRSVELLEQVRIPDPQRRIDAYPHELSGGMRQRVAIAMALSTEPCLLIADEPTTALDVTIQAQILDLIKSINEETGISTIMISHDFGVIAHTCDRTMVMNKGEIVEQGATKEVLLRPNKPYTRRLIDAIPTLTPKAEAAELEHRQVAGGLLQVSNLSVTFSSSPALPFASRSATVAVDDVSLEISRGEILGVVGESGCGKSSMSRAILGLIEQSSGRIALDGKDVSLIGDFRQRVQIVFQDPLASLNPRMTVEEIVREPLENKLPGLTRSSYRGAVADALRGVSLDEELIGRYPHQLSGGQCQRVGIARALVVEPDLVVCDESVSALDVTVQAEILALVRKLRVERNLAVLFISHDLAVIRQIADRVLVMYRGNIVESGNVSDVYEEAEHPYTQLLLRSVCHPDPDCRQMKFGDTVDFGSNFEQFIVE